MKTRFFLTILELLRLYFGIIYFQRYLRRRKFNVFFDNITLQYYKNLKILLARIYRFALRP
jgi:hypothetical protein